MSREKYVGARNLTTDDPGERDREEKEEEQKGETGECQVSGGLLGQKWDCGITCGQRKEDESEEGSEELWGLKECLQTSLGKILRGNSSWHSFKTTRRVRRVGFTATLD